MVLTKQQTEKILQAVMKKPRTVQELAKQLNVSWVTANRYVEKLSEEDGTLAIRTFRGGTRGALKIVYWAAQEPSYTSVQKRLLRQIEAGRTKYDFSPSEIYQYIERDKKRAWVLPYKDYVSKDNFNKFKKYLANVEEKVFFFSGNLSFSKIELHDTKILDILESLAGQGISIKILTSVDPVGLDNVKNVLAINKRLGKTVIDVRHTYQPLRATLFDDKLVNFKETRHCNKRTKASGELQEAIHIWYDIYDSEWIAWMEKVFWHLYRPSIKAENRIRDFEDMGYF